VQPAWRKKKQLSAAKLRTLAMKPGALASADAERSDVDTVDGTVGRRDAKFCSSAACVSLAGFYPRDAMLARAL